MASRPRSRNRRPKQRSRRVTCRIERVGHQGDGVASIDGKNVFVPLTLAGELVEADVSGDRAQVVRILEPSSDRVEPACGHFGVCGGCSLQHFAPDADRDWKRDIVVSALRNRNIACEVDLLIDAHGSGRRRATVHAVVTTNGVVAGFNQHRDRRIVDITDCPVLDPDIANIFEHARDLAEMLTTVRGSLHLRVLKTDEGIDLDIGGVDASELQAHESLANFAARHDLARLTLAGEQLVERRAAVIRMGEVDLIPAPTGFLQATRLGEETLCRLVMDHIPSGAPVADLFCGVGPFALRLASANPVMAVDYDEGAIAALDHAVRHASGLKPVSIVRRDLFEDPLDAQELADRACVIFDPPRAGAEAQARKIATSDVPTVIGVSCNPVTFARDASILIEGGYKLRRVTPLDQFRHTAHVEVVGVFERAG